MANESVQGGVAVVAPSMPAGATIIETSLQPQAASAPAPAAAPKGADASHNGQPLDADSVPALAGAYQPMDAESAAHVRAAAKLAGLPADAAENFMTLATKAQLPQGHAKNIAARLAHHHREMAGNLALSPEEHAEYAMESARMLGGAEKYQQTVERARAYLQSVGLLEYVDNEMKDSSVLYDPAVLITLAGLATARGVNVK